MKPGPKPTDPVIRFWTKVERGAPDECWMWTGGIQGKGYGQFYPQKRNPQGAHRFAWELANGTKVPPGMHVMHSCDTPRCVNPAHLSVGTAAQNHADKTAKGRNPGNRTERGRPLPKWSPEVVAAMRAQGMQYREIGEVLGVSGATAWRTLNKRRPPD
jgi:HNH endonuclease